MTLFTSGAFAEQSELIVIAGYVVDGGVVCTLFKVTDGSVLPLAGIPNEKFPVNTRLELEGSYITRSICQQGELAFRVDKVLKIDNQPK